MIAPDKPLLERTSLKAEFAYEFQDFRNGPDDRALKERIAAWRQRSTAGERESEAAFIQRFFVETWGYRLDDGSGSWSIQPQFPIVGAGAGGSTGAADLALGLFGGDGAAVGQVMCEFKGVGADLDKRQARKGSTRSPVEQGLDYLRFARRGLLGNEPVLPRFAIVTNMEEFRLYWWDNAPDRYQRFRLTGRDLLQQDLFPQQDLAGDTAEDAFDRFLFWRLFRPDMLVGQYGRTPLERLILRQGTTEKKLEKTFYREYRDYRNKLYLHVKLDPATADLTDTARLSLAQKLLDRLIFIMFAEDMGLRIAFPPQLLRDQLKRESLDPFYDGNDTRIWRVLQRLFALMDRGGELGDATIKRFNGGLFEPDARLDALQLPNHLFCARNQGRNAGTTEADKDTLLYLAATYDFAADGDGDKSIGLYTLGHIFEQSIDDLEVLEAEAQGRESIAELVGKRKREGVYYTPEPIVRRIVDETIGPLFARWREEAGWPDGADPTPAAARAYWTRLRAMTVVDPACGSGAFLITALRYLFAEFRAVADMLYDLDTASGAGAQRIGDTRLTDMILCDNLHGVDINPASVEIAQLSLWLHTARADTPLSSLNGRVVVGNSLIGPGFEKWASDRALSAEVMERVAPFDWRARFPRVWERGGFDAVIGNPPYVKLQNFARVYAETADYLRDDGPDGPGYRSTLTGNFDIYLPFVERGLSLLNEDGRMGYIAPNLWPTLEHGEGLRGLVRDGRHLQRWLDFRSHQVFEGLTTYTAIQVYTARPNDAVRAAFAPTGDLARVDWGDPAGRIPYDELPGNAATAWQIAPEPVRRMSARLAAECARLDDPAVTCGIIVGLQTSADHIYHLERLGNGRYRHRPKPVRGVRPPSFDVEIEDAIMRPLVSGSEAKRFIAPATDTYILFPYDLTAGGARLFTVAEMEARYGRAWTYLQRFEAELRARESKSFDDAEWYRFGRSQNLDKQENAKLIVAQLVPSLRVAYDSGGDFYANNVRVNGILPRTDGWFLLGVLNAPASDTLFRWRGKPKAGDYYEANRQFIKDLPVPNADERERAAVGSVAEGLQRGYTRRRRVAAMIEERLGVTSRRPRPHEWLLPDVRPVRDIEASKPRAMPKGDVRDWADARYKEQVATALARVDAAIRLDSVVAAELDEGALRARVDGVEVARTFVADGAGPFMLAQWQVAAQCFEPRGKDDGKRLIDALRRVASEADGAVRDQVIARQAELATLDAELRGLERELDDLTAALFRLTPEERALVRSR